jgi:hypothetical protein
LKKWDSNRAIQRDEIYRGLSLTRKRQLFARVAAETFQQGKYFIKQDFLVKHIETFLHKLPAGDQAGEIDGEVVLKAIEMQHSIFVERAQKIYSFSHLTFQEYFTAKYIADNPKAIKELMQHCSDKRWREVFLLTASLLDENNADEFFADFQRTVVALISQDKTLVKFLNWANEKAIASQSLYKPAAVRSAYIFLDLDLARSLNLDLAHAYSLAFARSRDLARARALDSALNRVLDLNLDFGIAHIRFRVLDLDLDCIRVLDLDLDSVLILDRPYSRYLPFFLRTDYLLAIALLITARLSRSDDREFQKAKVYGKISEVAKFCSELINTCQEFPELCTELQNLTFPSENDRQSVWQDFEAQLRDIMQRHGNIGHKWNLTEEQTGKLASYLEANELLVECLKLAMVSDRKAIEDRVLLLTD